MMARDLIPKSGYYYPNRIARIYLEAMEEVMGRNGLHALLNLVGLHEYRQQYPPDNLEREFDFADFSNLNRGLFDIYGPRGGRGLALRGGRATFARGLKGFGALAGVGDLAFRMLPLSTKLRVGLPALARIFTQFSDQISHVKNFDDHFRYYIDRCPVCWGQEFDRPSCFVAAGLLQESLTWVSGGDEFRVEEISCIATGERACVFRIEKQPIR
ncbi:MAG: 4-vinyl reductase [Candidatus Promineifilaceae bacterium]|nr:4-vinyl reductase [Candidatus Promineifilaceae bacterium]